MKVTVDDAVGEAAGQKPRLLVGHVKLISSTAGVRAVLMIHDGDPVEVDFGKVPKSWSRRKTVDKAIARVEGAVAGPFMGYSWEWQEG